MFVKTIFYIFLAAASIISKCGSIIVDKCPDMEPMKDFDFNKFKGLKYQFAEYPDKYESGPCVMADFSNPIEGNSYMEMNIWSSNDLKTIQEKANTKTDPQFLAKGMQVEGEKGKYSVVDLIPFIPAVHEFYFLDTDYNKYVVIYSCYEDEGQNTEYAWALSNQIELPSPETYKKVIEVLIRYNLSTDPFENLAIKCLNN